MRNSGRRLTSRRLPESTLIPTRRKDVAELGVWRCSRLGSTVPKSGVASQQILFANDGAGRDWTIMFNQRRGPLNTCHLVYQQTLAVSGEIALSTATPHRAMSLAPACHHAGPRRPALPPRGIRRPGIEDHHLTTVQKNRGNLLLVSVFLPLLAAAGQLQQPGTAPEQSSVRGRSQRQSSGKQMPGMQAQGQNHQARNRHQPMSIEPATFIDNITNHMGDGTSVELSSTPTPMLMTMLRNWMLMLHGVGFFNAEQQTAHAVSTSCSRRTG